MGFVVDPAFETGSVFAADWPLCQVRLQDDARFPWLILIPRVEGATEIDGLDEAQRAELMAEIVRASTLMRVMGERLGRPIDKLNVAALGNVTTQLHVHVVGRRRDDPEWPHPVWGRGRATPHEPQTLAALLSMIAT